MQEKIRKAVETFYRTAQEGLPRKTEIRVPEIRFDLKGRAAGQWRMHKGCEILRFNPEAFLRDWDSHFPDTVAHEVAHSLVFRSAGNRVRPHGPEWRHFMQKLGCEPRVTHNTPLSGRRMRTYKYICDCRQHTLSARRHYLIQHRRYRYQCRQCGTTLRKC